MSAESKNLILITGAGGAVGEAMVEHFLEKGAVVVGWDLSAPGEGELREDSQREGFFRQKVDVTKAAGVEAAFKEVEAKLGETRAVIHLAGGFRWSKIDEIGVEDIDFLVDVNLRSSLYLARAAMKRFKARGRGRMIFMSSRSTNSPGVGEGAYAATKAGLNALTLSLAAEVKDSAITVNALQPSVIDTEANRRDMPDADFSTWVPRSHLAEMAEYLLSESGASINGALIAVSGRT